MRACKAPPSIYCLFFSFFLFTVADLFVCLLLFICLLIIYWFELTTSVSSRQFATDTKQYGLRIGHVNVYHLYNKVQDVCMLLTKSRTFTFLDSARPALILVLVMNHDLFPANKIQDTKLSHKPSPSGKEGVF